ncbi:MAG: efflux RND transporter periplasmic adaptor subunit [Candidatus Omnitrophica bacterium]|nr:efflux RND transporter periplasmic adaptor subunit [Candidatus Omnitrophota bacterium]
MTKNKMVFAVFFMVLIVSLALWVKSQTAGPKNRPTQSVIVMPSTGEITRSVITTGAIEPQNRLEIKPSISGRVDEILVKEGDKVKTGQVLVWMSSTERAALIDAARSQGGEVLKYWEDVYKKTPIISPIDGEVIVRSVEPGQTVVTSDPMLVLSDRLIVSAQFDETDIAKVKAGQKAVVTLDAYPDVKLNGIVSHIAYESEIVNNVTIYDVDIVPDNIPDFLRSGMSVTAEVIEESRQSALTVPYNAIRYDNKRQYVVVRDAATGKLQERDVEIGLYNDKTAEILSGLGAADNVVLENNSYMPQRKVTAGSPFMPSGKKNDKNK